MSNDGGFLGVLRKIQEHWIYQDSKCFHIWIEMLMLAQFEPSKVKMGKTVISLERGQFIYGRESWASRLGITEWQLRTTIDLLIRDKMIELVQKYSKFTVYKVTNYDKYNPVSVSSSGENLTQPHRQQNRQQQTLEPQGISGIDRQQNRQQNRQQPATYNNKELKNLKDIIHPDGWTSIFDTLWAAYPSKIGKTEAKLKFKKYYDEKKGDVEPSHIIERINAYKAFCLSKDRPYKDGSTFFNQRAWEEDWGGVLEGPKQKPVELTPERSAELAHVAELQRKRNLAANAERLRTTTSGTNR